MQSSFHFIIYILFYLTITFNFSSCNQNPETVSTVPEIDVDSVGKVSLIEKYSPICWNDTTYRYVYQLQEKESNDSILVLFKGKINELIIRNENLLMLSNCTFFRKNCIAEIIIPEKIKEKYLKDLNNSGKLSRFSRFYFVIKLTAINSSSRLQINSYVTKGGSIDDAESELEYDFNNSITILKGNLVDYYKFEN